MFEAVDAVALLRAVLPDECRSDDVARKHLIETNRRGMDPLDYAAHHLGMVNALFWRRAAAWAGYVFADQLPSHPSLPRGPVDRIEHLGGMRTLRQKVLDRELTFVAPGFDHVINFRRSWSADLHCRIRFATADAIEAAIARAASEQLMD